MGLLQRIQADLVEMAPLGSIFLKVRVLAAKLGSVAFEDWVRHEMDGYPEEVSVPEYRKTSLIYRGHFMTAAWAYPRAPIPNAYVRSVAGDDWVDHSIRCGLSAVEECIRNINTGTKIGIDASNLLYFFNKQPLFEGSSCTSVEAEIPAAVFNNIQNTVRSRLLEFALQLERDVPEAIEIAFETNPQTVTETAPEKADRLVFKILGNNNNSTVVLSNESQVSVKVRQGDLSQLIEALTRGGIPRPDAQELAEIAASETPESADEPFGPKIKRWLGNIITKAAEGTVKIGINTVTAVATECLKQYYGLKP